METLENNKQLVTAFFDALNAGDVARMMSLYHPDAECWTSGNTLISGTMKASAMADGASAIFEAFPEGLTFTVHAMTAEGGRVAVEAESYGRHSSGPIYNNLYHFLFEIEDGQVRRLKEYMDTELVTDILCGGQRPG